MRRATATATCFVVMLAMTAAIASAQQRIDVEAGQNTLLDALAQAQPGDTLVLVTDGGAYENDDELRVEMPLTIMAADGLAARPVLTNNGDDSTKDIIRVYNDLTLDGLEFDGLADTDKKAKYAIRNSSGSDQANVKVGYVLKILNCYFHDIVSGSDGNAFRAYWDTYADSIIVRNTLVRNTGKEAIRVRDEDNERPGFGFFNVKYFEVSNSTFWDIKNDAISVYGGDEDPNTDGPEVVIDHVTIYNTGHYLINLKDVENAVVTNSILMNNYDIVNGTNKTLGAPWLVPGSRIAYTDTLNISDDGDWTGGRGDPTIEHLYAVDPMFVDPANGDFTIPAGSPVIGMGENGATLGDPRWASDAPLPMTHQIEAGQNTLMDAVDAAGPGDIIELTTSGGEYLNDSDMNVYEPITIRAAAGLAEMPVIKNNEPDESTRVVFDIFDSLHLDGIEIDGQAGTDFNAKYLLRIRNSGSNLVDSTTVLRVTNSYIHDVIAGSDGNFLRQYTATYADSVIFENVLFDNSGKEGIRIKDESSERPNMGFFNVGYFEMSNSTMANTAQAAIYVYGGDSDPATPEPEFVVDRLTCYNCGHKNGRSIWPRDIYAATITNSNIANSKDDGEYTIKLYGDSQISYTNLFGVSPLVLEGNSMSSNMHEVDPEFANPDSLDFMLPSTSSLLSAGSDGGPVGDPRWVPVVRPGTEGDVVSGAHGFLGQNYPNPFNGRTVIPYQVDRPAHVRLEVYDILGRRVAQIADGMHAPGEYRVQLDMPGKAPGHYLYTLVIDGQVQRRTLVLIR